MSTLWSYFFGKWDETMASEDTIQQRNLLLKQIKETKQFKLKSVEKDIKTVSLKSTKPVYIPKRKRLKNRKKHIKRSHYEF